MKQFIISKVSTVLLVVAAGIMGAVFSRMTTDDPTNTTTLPNYNPLEVFRQITDTPAQDEEEETIPPTTPLPTLTPSRTLKPPPTFEPPTPTPFPTALPTNTPQTTQEIQVSLPGLNGAETPTPTTTPSCVPNEDWKLIYEVQFGDALATIAEKYGTTMFDLARGNCLKDMNLISVGQKLRVPGDAAPLAPEVECIGFELLTPLNGAVTIPGSGQLTFNWRGPRAPLNLIRIWKPNGEFVEFLVELRQNETINLGADLPDGGTYTWYVYPLNRSYQQICPEGGPWTFTKEALQ